MMLSDNSLKIFSKEISSFKNGTYNYEYNFTNSGSVLLFSSSSNFNQNILKINSSNFNYDIPNYMNHVDVGFIDFPLLESSSSVEPSSNKVISELNSTVSKLESKLSASYIDSELLSSTQADIQAARDVIIQLRISAGQGRTEADFSQHFPYLSINSNKGQ